MKKQYSLFQSFGFAWQGIQFAIQHNRNVRIHFAIAIAVLLLSFLLQITFFETALVLVMILLVICTEMINTVIEEMIDLLTKDYSQHAKVAKDVGAGMVLLTSLGAAVIGVVIFVPHLMKLLQG